MEDWFISSVKNFKQLLDSVANEPLDKIHIASVVVVAHSIISIFHRCLFERRRDVNVS